ncbi:MAG TPA: GNAT family N-acetyltransferase [Burkholderiaceae bacterium]|nr:GNAT family N-acetyltransferase [Burkholderiaceae bacterium]
MIQAPPELHTERLTLRLAQPDDAAATVAFFERNREHLARWDPPPPEGFYTEPYWRRYGETAQGEWSAGVAVRLNVFARGDRAHDRQLLARINYTQIARGPFHSCVLGYSLDVAQEGRGVMSEALRAANGFMFSVQRMHRIQAAVRPENIRSLAVMRRLGFQCIGLAPLYLFIDGAWRDHELYQLINTAMDVRQAP